MEQLKTNSKGFLRTKKIQITILLVLSFISLALFFTSSSLQQGISSDSHLLLILMTLFILFIISFVFIYLDFKKYAPAILESDNIKKTAYLDDLTGMPNKFSCDLIFQMYATPNQLEHVGCALIVIGNLVTINSVYGRDAGNQAITDFGQILKDVSEDFGFIGRNGGNEFLLVIEKCNEQLMEDFFKQLDIRLARYNVLNLNHPIGFYFKYVLNDEFHATCFSDLITEVYQRLHTSPARYN